MQSIRPAAAILLAFLCHVAFIPAAGQTTIGAGPTSPGFSTVYYQQSLNYQVGWGQSFRTPDAGRVRLDSWSFWTNDYWSTEYFRSTAVMRLQIVEWTPQCGVICEQVRSVGTPVFSSATRTPTSGSSPERLEFSVGVLLDPTRMYLAFLQPVDVRPGVRGESYGYSGFYFACNECANYEPYEGGSVVDLESIYDPTTGQHADLLTTARVTERWDKDSRFEATFSEPVSTVPEPATLTFLATGLAGIAAAARRRKRATRIVTNESAIGLDVTTP